MENWLFVYTIAQERSAEVVARANAVRTLDGTFAASRRAPRRRLRTRLARIRHHVMLRRGLGRFIVVFRSRRLRLSLSVVRVCARCAGEGRGQSVPR